MANDCRQSPSQTRGCCPFSQAATEVEGINRDAPAAMGRRVTDNPPDQICGPAERSQKKGQTMPAFFEVERNQATSPTTTTLISVSTSP